MYTNNILLKHLCLPLKPTDHSMMPNLSNATHMKNTMHTLEDRLTNTNRDIECVTCMQRELVESVDYVENQTRRNNLQIDRVAEVTAETWADSVTVVRKTFIAALKLPELQVNVIRIYMHRARGSNASGRPKTIVVKFESYKDRDTILQATRKQKPRGIFINEDLSHRVMER